MSFQKGLINFRALYLTQPAAESLPEAMRAKPVPLDEDVTGTACLGFVDVREYAGYQCARIRMSQRKVPQAIVRDRVEVEVRALMSRGEKVNRRTRTEIKEAVVARLLPGTPVSHTDIELVWKTGDRKMYTSAMSSSALDRVRAQLFVVQCQCLVLRSGTMAQIVLPSTRFNALALEGLGESFLTWLWYKAEEGEQIKDIQLGVSGPLVLVHDDAKAHTLTLKGDLSPISPEAGAALREGKLVKSMSLAMAEAGDVLLAKLDSFFGVRGLGVPAKQPDPVSTFQARVMAMEQWMENLETLFREYLERGKDESMTEWMEEK